MTPFHPDSPTYKLAVEWYNHVEKYAPRMDLRSMLETQSFLSGKSTQPKVLKQIMSDILGYAPDLREQVGQATLRDYELCANAMLLVWALTSPWGESVRIAKTVDQWGTNKMFGFSPGEDVQRCTTLLHFATPLADRMQSPHRLELFAALERWMLPGVPSGTTKGIALESHHNFYMAMGHCALHALGLPSGKNLEEPNVVNGWMHRLAEACTGPFEAQRDLACTLVFSDLPALYKFNALRQLPGPLWLLPEVKDFLMPHMPALEHERLGKLPWLYWTTKASASDAMHRRQVNQTVVREYCPQIVDALTFAGSEEDWSSQTGLIRVAHTMHVWSVDREKTGDYPLPEGIAPP